MGRLKTYFDQNDHKILSIFCTAGYPYKEGLLDILPELDTLNIDVVEIGIPYSDPMADGPTIQASSEVALKNGITLDLIFEQLSYLRPKLKMAMVLMGYYNTILQYGLEKFASMASKTGIHGVIIPDLPLLEYQEQVQPIFDKYQISMVFMVSSYCSDERIILLDQASDGFLYVVGAKGVTGARSEFSIDSLAFFKRLNAMKLTNRLIVGFGISNSDQINVANQYLDGVIIGSAFVNAIQNKTQDNMKNAINSFIQKLRK